MLFLMCCTAYFAQRENTFHIHIQYPIPVQSRQSNLFLHKKGMIEIIINSATPHLYRV
jgi:hypothetical protein